MERNWSTAAAVMANPTEAREEIHALRAEVERLREALVGVTRILEAFSYTTQFGKTQRARLEAARAALGAAE